MVADTDDLMIDFDEYAGTPVNTSELTDEDELEESIEQEDSYDFKQKSQPDKSVINTILAQKGFNNPDKIKILDEDGYEEVVSFDGLTEAEQLSLLDSPDTVLDDSEIEVINFLRTNNTTLEQIIKYREAKAVEAALAAQDAFSIDQVTDEELYVADLKSRYPSLTDDELGLELEKEMSNDSLFRKKVDTIREQYEQMEIQEQEERALDAQREIESNYEMLAASLLEVAQDTDDLYTLELEDQDKDDVLRFLLEKDVNGQSDFIKSLDDPKTLFKLAWFAIKGNEAFDTIHQYYKKEIETTRRGVNNPRSRPTETVRRATQRPSVDKFGLEGILK